MSSGPSTSLTASTSHPAAPSRAHETGHTIHVAATTSNIETTTASSTPAANSPWRPSPVYTFLATLVLLLSVSAAIVIRSFILRRRHRRMVEEAIRNGTWVPQNVPPSGRAPRVDLSKKPVMWEAYLGGGGIYRAEKGGRDLASSYSSGGEKASIGGLDGAEWESIKPFYASLVQPVTHSGVNGSRGGGGLGSDGSDDTHDGGTGNRPSFVNRIGAGVRHIFRTTSSSPASPLPTNQNNSTPNAGANHDTGNAEEEGAVGESEKPPSVRVAVLIAMPTPPKSSSASSSSNVSPSPEGPSTSSMVLSPATSHPLSPSSSQQPPQASSAGDSEEPLPVLEMGVAEVMLLHHDEDGNRLSGETGRVPPGKEAVGRDSASMTVEV
ncbi:hypothetical protein MD484_g5737, partial [Candolleomyces efflorescens]